MWINIEVVSENEKVIYIPKEMAKEFNKKVKISFGSRTVTAVIEPEDDMEASGGSDFEDPLKIRLSHKLAIRLQIPRVLTYQMKYDEDNMVIGPVIGLLLGNRNYLYTPRHMEKYSDRFGIYNQVGGLIYAFSPKTIDWENSMVYGLYYNNVQSAWKFGRFPLPSVIYRRDFHSSPDIIKRLIEVTKGRMFNSWRFTKLYLYRYIKRDKELSEYLPPTELSRSYEQVKAFIDSNKGAILKPIDLSRGRGICFIKKYGNVYKISDYRYRITKEIEVTGSESLRSYFDSNKEFFNRYLIQKRLSLARINGSCFDIRVVMQKDKTLKWKCTGIECRVAAKGSLLTNISKGGYALSIDEAFREAFSEDEEDNEKLKQQLDDLCHKLCIKLDDMNQHFAEFGLDIAVDEDKNLWIIEANVFPSFKGFKRMDYETYLNIRYTPILYASHITGF